MLNHIIHSFNHISYLTVSDLNIYLYLVKIKQHLNSIIESIHKILLKSVKYISYVIRIIAFYFNVLLQVYYQSFIKKLGEHKSSLQLGIKNYIENINRNLSQHSSFVEKFIKSISQNMENFDSNYQKIGLSSRFDTLLRIIKIEARFKPSEILEILSSLIEYRELLRQFNRHKSKLSSIIRQLEFYSSQFVNKTVNYDKSSNPNIIDEILTPLQNFKAHVVRFIGNIQYVQKLDEIGKHIKTMKSQMDSIKDQVLPEVKDYIEVLANITIKKEDVQSSIETIRNINNLVIPKLEVARYRIEFYRSLDSAISNLNGVGFTKYDFNEFLKNSSQIKDKLNTFQEQIKLHVKKLRESYRQIKDHIVVVEGDTYDESYYENLVKPVESLINNLSQEISTIRYMVYCLLIIKYNSINIDSVRKKIIEITDVDTGLKNLPEILKHLRLFYSIHRNSMNMVILFNSVSFARHSINEYVNSLRRVKYLIEILIFAIKCYIITLSVIKYVTGELNAIKPKIEDLKSKPQEIKILSTHTLNIKKYLESINSSIKSLEQVNTGLNINNLKNNISLVKYHIREVYQNILVVKVKINEIIKITSQLVRIKDEINKIQKTVNDMIIEIISFIYYLKGYIIILYEATGLISEEKRLVFQIHSASIFKMIENLAKIGDYLNCINSVIDKMGIDKFIEIIESQISSTETLVNNIQSSVDKINKGVVDVECAIEGVVRNFIGCSLKSLTSYLETPGNQDVPV